MSERGYLVDRCPRCGCWMPRATPDQHAALEMVLIDISKQLKWHGEYRGPKAWAQLMMAAYDRAHGRGDVELVPAIDGVGFDGGGFDFVRRRKRSRLNIVEGSEIIEFANAWAIDHGVKLNKPKKKAA